jgi:hypothetical protein
MDCEPPFWEHPAILYKHLTLQYKPVCEHSIMNFVARIMIVSIVVGAIGSLVAGLSFVLVALLFGAITAAAIVYTTPVVKRNNTQRPRNGPMNGSMNGSRNGSMNGSMNKPTKYRKQNEYQELPMTVMVDPSSQKRYGTQNNDLSSDPSRSKQNFASTTEHFVNGPQFEYGVQPYSTGDVSEPFGRVEVDATPYAGPSFPDYTPPTSKNLFMNVLLDEYKYNPDRPEAAPIGNPTVKQTLDDFFRVHWYSDPTDVFGKTQNQRQFVTQPSTTVPNDQGSFANWLYKIPGKTCKEGGRDACLSGTDNGTIPWLNQSS